LYRAWPNKWKGKFQITSKGTRNDLLSKLVGETFYQIGRGMARRIAEEQYRSKMVETATPLSKHMESFSDLWARLDRKWRARMGQAERESFEGLETDNLKDAFRIIWSYQQLAVANSKTDFAIAATDLGERLGITLQGACAIRKTLVGKGVLVETAPYQPNRQAARYAWNLSSQKA
jgi:hypothetical protein